MGKNIWRDKMPGEKTSGGTKRPGGQNIQRDKMSGDRTTIGTKRPGGQNIRGNKDNDRQGKKSPLINGRKLVKTLGNNVCGRKNAWQRRKSPLSKLT
jgi:hypothetical protein